MRDIDALIAEADSQLSDVRGLYEASLRAQEVTSTLQVKIKNVLENQRSALEYLAHAIVERDGKAGARSYFPLASASDKFPDLFESQMKGVAGKRPDIRDAIEQRPPYQQGYEWLGQLGYLTNENKHRVLSPQTRTETHRRSAAGGAVTWDPSSVKFGSGVSIGGQQVDPLTQRTADTIDLIYVDWLFEQLGVSALGTLDRIQGGLPTMVAEICHVAGL